MKTPSTPLERLHQVLRLRYGSLLDGYLLPPPSFISLQGEILGFDEQAGTLNARYPILESQLNPYQTLQGGFMAAAVDNTFGPLSLLVAPPNVTRRIELTYQRPATLDMGYILARAQATPWIIDPDVEAHT